MKSGYSLNLLTLHRLLRMGAAPKPGSEPSAVVSTFGLAWSQSKPGRFSSLQACL